MSTQLGITAARQPAQRLVGEALSEEQQLPSALADKTNSLSKPPNAFKALNMGEAPL